MNILGFDIGGTKCAVVLCDLQDGRIIWQGRIETASAPDWKQVLETLAAGSESLMVKAGVTRSDCRIGISCGGPLDPARKRICSPPNLPGWDKVPAVDYLQTRLGMPARMLNDADACALAEWQFGAGKGTENMVFLTFGTGLGAGLILNGRLYSGALGLAGEAGHLRMAPDGPVGYGKAGSLEGFCSGAGIRRMGIAKALKYRENGRRVSFDRGDPAAITARDVIEAAGQGCREAEELLAVSGSYFGRGLAILIDLLNPDMIVAGSIYVRARQWLEPAMRQAVREEALAPAAAACRIEPAGLGEQIGDYGAVMAAVWEESLWKS